MLSQVTLLPLCGANTGNYLTFFYDKIWDSEIDVIYIKKYYKFKLYVCSDTLTGIQILITSEKWRKKAQWKI